MKKRILFLEQQSWQGGAQRVLEIVLSSVGDEFECVVAFPDLGPFCAALHEKGIETVTWPLGRYRPGKKSYFEMIVFALRSLICGLKMAAVIQRRGIGLVYINGPRCLPAGILAASLTGRPTLFHLHLIPARKSEIFLVTRLTKYVSKIVACSRAAAAPLLNADHRLSAKTQVLYSVPGPLGMICGGTKSTPAGPLVTDLTHLTLGMVGRITETKGQQLLLNAAGRLRPELKSKTRFIMVGAPAPGCREDLQYSHRLEASAVRHGLSEQILWTGYQPKAAVCYAMMDVLVQPSSDEALGLVILEALQRGVPVIATRVGGMPEIIRDGSNGLLVPPGDESALAEALERFLEDGALRERLRAGARESLDERFSLENFTGTIRDLVSHLFEPSIALRTRG